MKFNDNFTSGIPDCYFSGPTGDLWVEFKWYPHNRKLFDLTANKHPKLSRLQQLWLNERNNEGRDCWVIVGFPGGGIILTHGEWNYKVFTDGHYLTIRQVAQGIEDWCGIRERDS